ncbi:MAG: helix-turn-helix domain-containing protein [Desulfobulbaceae bacterium]|nr:helix-turn-helix domain-containing protein [Desulfobulbaceae bacterium]
MINKHLPPANQAMVSRESLGNRLRTTRLSRNTSLAEAATATRISQRILTALEADDFAALPAEVFTRGFIKLYAEHLGLNPNEVLTLFTDQENLDPERPADRPYRNDILHGTSMAHPLHLLKGNPRLRIIAILLAALLSFYVLGAIFKSIQKHPDQDSPENDVAKSLVNGQPQMLPPPAGEEQPSATDSTVPGPAVVPTPGAPQADRPPTPGAETASNQGQVGGNNPNLPPPVQTTSAYPRLSASGNPEKLTPPETPNPQPLAAPGAAPGATPANPEIPGSADSRRAAPTPAIPR